MDAARGPGHELCGRAQRHDRGGDPRRPQARREAVVCRQGPDRDGCRQAEGPDTGGLGRWPRIQ